MPQDGDPAAPILKILDFLFPLLHQLLKEISSGPCLPQDASTAYEL